MSDSSRLRRRLLTLSSALLGLPSLAAAQTWTGAGVDNRWNTAANWNPAAIPGPTSAITFPNLTNANQRYSVSYLGNFSYASMTFTSTNTYSIASASPLTLGNTFPDAVSLNVTGSGGVILNNPVTHNSNTTFAATGSNITFNSGVTTGTGLTLTLNAAANRTVSFNGTLTINSNSTILSSGNGTVIFNNSGAVINASSSVRALAGTMVIQNNVLINDLSAEGGTVRVLNTQLLFGDASITNGSLVDLQASQSLGTLNITTGQIQGAIGTSLTLTSGVVVPAASGATPILGAITATPSISGAPGARASGFDLDIAANLTAATTSYTSSPGGFAIRFQAGSAQSTTLRARVLDGMSWHLNGGRPVATNGLIEAFDTLDLFASNFSRTLDATVRVKTGGTFRPQGANQITLTSLVTEASSSTFITAPMVITGVQNSGIIQISSNSTFTSVNNFNSFTFGIGSSGSTVASLANTAAGVVSIGGNEQINASIDNAGKLQVGTGTIQLVGTYIHRPGADLDTFATGNGRFTVSSSSPAQGFKFLGDYTLPAGALLEARGQAGFTNTATFTLAGGTLAVENSNSNAPHVNLGTLTGLGTLDAIANSTLTFFFNDGVLKPVGTINTTGPLALVNRLGTVEITTGNKLGLQSGFGTFNNRSLVTLAGGTLGDSNTSFLNDASGLVTGYGRIGSNLSNNGVFRVTGGQLLALDGSLTNTGSLRIDNGLMQLNSLTNPSNTGLIVVGPDGFLTGSISTTLANSGRIQGGGQINFAINNNTGGRIEPVGTLTLGRALTNTVGGQINLNLGSTLYTPGGFAFGLNLGLIAMAGGSLDTATFELTNASTGSITGWGSLTTGGLRNSGNMTLSGGTSLINGPVANDAGRNLRVQSAVAIFTGPVTNNGSLIVTNGDAIFTGGFSGGAPLGAPLAATPNALAGTGNTTLNPNTFLESDGLTQNALTVGAGARVLVSTREPDAVAVDGRSAPASTSVLETISIAKDVGTWKYTGFVDLTTNDLVVRSPNRAGQVAEIANLRDMVRGWYTGQRGLPSQTGLGTTAAFYNPLDAFVTLSVFDNDPNGDGVGELATFNGLAILATDVIVKYTYLGDTDLDGQVTATDLARVLMGLNGQGTGWNFGDVDHDGVVTNFDLGRTMAALRGQGAPLGFVAGGGGGAIPEPGSVGLIAAAGLGLMRRRR